MEIPKYIKTAIKRTASSAETMANNSAIVRNWLNKNGLYEDNPEADCEIIEAFIDYCELGNNLPDLFIEMLEQKIKDI